jgi:hypothetical protein
VRRSLVLAAFASLVIPAAADSARQYPWFHLGTRAVYCHVDLNDPRLPLLCWRPITGYVVAMSPTGRVKTETSRKWKKNWEDTSPILRMGKSWRYGGFKCTVRPDGRQITCINKKKHGWALGPAKAKRLF